MFSKLLIDYEKLPEKNKKNYKLNRIKNNTSTALLEFLNLLK
jgi:hypothetical protein